MAKLNLPANRQNFILRRPRKTHRRPATCKEVDCPRYILGFKIVVPTVSDHANTVRHVRHGRFFTERKVDDILTEFIFPAGQNCFTSHTAPIERDPIRIHKVNGQKRFFDKGEDFNDNMNEEMHKLEQARKRG